MIVSALSMSKQHPRRLIKSLQIQSSNAVKMEVNALISSQSVPK